MACLFIKDVTVRTHNEKVIVSTTTRLVNITFADEVCGTVCKDLVSRFFAIDNKGTIHMIVWISGKKSSLQTSVCNFSL